jgi:hypothetical protein
MQILPSVPLGLKKWNIWGHIISHEGLKVDPNKIKVMREWTIPKTLKKLRRFLGLENYYRKFFNNYDQIETPLSTLLKKEAFF